MKIILSLLVILAGLTARAVDSDNNDFGKSESEVKQIGHDEFAYRFHIQGDIFVVSSDGEKLVNLANESREWQFAGPGDKPLESNWRFQQNGLPLVALKQKWTLQKDGKLSLEITQYESMERSGNENETKYGRLVKEQKFTINNFAPVDWVIAAGAQKLVVRLTPALWPAQEAIDIANLPVSGKNIVVYDRAGKLWADQVSPDHPSSFLGISTHAGSVFLSYKTFKGAKIIGEVKDGRMKLKSGKNTLIILSETPFVPRNIKVNVYGIILSEKRTSTLNSVRTYSSSKEEEFLAALNRN